MKSTIPILTPLRGIAAICVVFFHARLILFPQWMAPLTEYTHFVENGFLWVDLFFILSGVVMMHVYQPSFVQDISLSKWKSFMWMRFARIYPLFFITLIVLILWETVKASHGIGFYGGALFEKWGMSGIPAFEGPFNRTESILANILMLHGLIVKDLSWNISSWSLSVEWLSYMVFPFLVPFLSRKKLSFLFPTICLIGLLYINHSKGSLDVTGGISAFIRAITSFTLGAWMYTLSISTKQQRLLNNDFALLTVFAICIGLLHLPKSNYHNVFVVLSFAALVFIAIKQSERDTPVFKVLDNRFTRFLGDISYSIYLWHAVLLLAGIELANLLFPEQLITWQSQTSWATACVGAVIFIATVIGISTISYFWIEKPAMRALRRRSRIKASATTA